MDEMEKTDREEVFSRSVRAGKRTYFFDVKTTRANDLFLTITESKKKFKDDGRFYYEKHKIFLYKEDFEKFEDSLKETLEFIAENKSRFVDNSTEVGASDDLPEVSEFSEVSFEDLDGDNA